MQTNANAHRDLDTLTALNRDYTASVQKGDVKRFEEILADDFMKNLRCQVFAFAPERGHERIHGNPAPRFQFDSHRVGPMPQYIAEALADFFESLWFHGKIPFQPFGR